MNYDIKSSDVVFFLGAGASVDAGVPDTHSFVKQFIKSIEEPTKKKVIEKIIETLEKWKKPTSSEQKIDIEHCRR